jgi:hypothetical protein
MDLLCLGSVLNEATVDDGVVIHHEFVLRVVEDIGRHLALVGHSIRREDGARLATMCRRLRGKSTRWLAIMPNRKLD